MYEVLALILHTAVIPFDWASHDATPMTTLSVLTLTPMTVILASTILAPASSGGLI